MPEPTYAVTASGECRCGTTVTAVGGAIPERCRPDLPWFDDDGDLHDARRLGDSFSLHCICGLEVKGRIVGLTVEPFQAVQADDDDEEASE